jgi:hypothetical protein
MSTLDNIKDHFKLPIYYNKEKQTLKQNIIDDLELTKTIDCSSNPIYHYFFDNSNELSSNVMNQVTEYYTTDKMFLEETQQFLKKYKGCENKYTDISKNYNKFTDIWFEIKNDTGFKEKYYYIDWSMLEFLNKSDKFLQIMSIYNMISPLISLCIPIIILIIPFFVIKLKGMNLTMNEYVDVLKFVVSNHSIGKLFTQFNTVSTNEKVYMIISAAFYIFSIYQNLLVCIRFNNNMTKIHSFIHDIEEYLEYTISSMNNYLSYSSEFDTQQEFNNTVKTNLDKLVLFKQKISVIGEYKITNYKKVFEIGHILKYFYEFYDDKVYNDAFMYSFGFNGYVDCIEGLQKNIKEKTINFIEFVDDNKKTNFKKNYHACLKNNDPIKNTIKMNKNIIISGPNASGKTTILKSTLINVIFSQQFGCGFYDSGMLKPYKFIHCYLNIPDTSGRDSLFQAEARRCKEILDTVISNKDDNHLCVFDELYSGTNPEEAVISAIAFMEYLSKNHNVSCMLTTHFIKVCKELKKNENIINYHMVATKTDARINYTYKLKSGISSIKGGVNVLHDMNYPKEILDKIE